MPKFFEDQTQIYDEKVQVVEVLQSNDTIKDQSLKPVEFNPPCEVAYNISSSNTTMR